MKEIKDLYASVIYQVALRTMWECFAASEAQDVVETVVFNGIVPATNRATGQPEELHLVSAPASRATFSELVLDQLDPAACLEAMGFEVRVTQSSRDEGIDAVAYNKTDIVHQAEILIQAKRYSKCVPTNDVRALAGSVEEKRATAGVLVTTAWVSAETKAFAARNNRLRIIEGGELKHLLAEYLNLDVRIDLARRPKRPM